MPKSGAVSDPLPNGDCCHEQGDCWCPQIIHLDSVCERGRPAGQVIHCPWVSTPASPLPAYPGGCNALAGRKRAAEQREKAKGNGVLWPLRALRARRPRRTDSLAVVGISGTASTRLDRSRGL